MEYQLEEGMLREFEAYLVGEERSRETVKKYLRDVRRFFQEKTTAIHLCPGSLLSAMKKTVRQKIMSRVSKTLWIH